MISSAEKFTLSLSNINIPVERIDVQFALNYPETNIFFIYRPKLNEKLRSNFYIVFSTAAILNTLASEARKELWPDEWLH